jgi:hypothetical protein
MIGQPAIAAGMNPRALAIANPNKDDFDDVFVANWGGASVGVFIGDGIGYPNPASVGSGTNPSSIAMGDVNGDGKLDLAVANYADSTVGVSLGNGLGGFGPATTSPVGGQGYTLALADFSGDG